MPIRASYPLSTTKHKFYLFIIKGALLEPLHFDPSDTVPQFHITDVKSIIEDNIKAEQGAIETYLELEEFTKDNDIVTHTKVEEILSDEREHLHLLDQILRDIK